MVDLVTSTAVIGTWVLIVGTLAFAYGQMRQTRRINSATTILDLRNRFEAPSMIAARRSKVSALDGVCVSSWSERRVSRLRL